MLLSAPAVSNKVSVNNSGIVNDVGLGHLKKSLEHEFKLYSHGAVCYESYCVCSGATLRKNYLSSLSW